MREFVLMGAAALLLSSRAEGAVLRVPSEYPTINAALDVAGSGDSVLVAPGTYDQYETRMNVDGVWMSAVAFAKAGVVLRSEEGATATTLRLDSTAGFPRLVYAYPLNGPFELLGFTLTGSVMGLRCIQVHGSGSLKVEDCEFRDFGTGATNETGMTVSTDLVVRRCFFHDINASTGGGLGQGVGSLLIEDCEFSDCRSGAAFGIDGGPLIVRRSRFVNNMKTTGGGGAFYAYNRTTVLFEDCWFEGNQSIGPSSSGGAIQMGGANSNQTVRNCTFVGNYTNLGGKGGAVRAGGYSVLITESTFFGNGQELDWSNGGAAIDLEGTSHVLRSNIIAASTGDQAVGLNAGTLQTSCNVYWENALGNTQGFSLDPTDLMADPQFCNAPALDFTVSETSPCLPGNGNPSCMELIGAWGEGCGAVSVDPSTWGKLKSRFRSGDEELQP